MTAIFAFAAALSIAAEPTYAQMTAAPASWIAVPAVAV